MAEHVDLVLINPGDRRQVYQDLGRDFSAIEPPFWIAAIAACLRAQHWEVAIIDANALNITPEETAAKVSDYAPLLSAVIVYGSQPSASTQTMTIAGAICRQLSAQAGTKVAIGGLHPSALPLRTLQEEAVDFVIEGEGAFTLAALLGELKAGSTDYSRVPGLWYRRPEGIAHTDRPALADQVDEILPVAAWDLLPMDRYKAHNWHCFGHLESRQPYAALYTSLGCPYNCTFCCINAPFGKPGIRYRSPEVVLAEIDLLVGRYGVKNIKIIDELFVLHQPHYMRIVEMLISRGYGLNIWAYARVDTVVQRNLFKMRQAGITWLALGIESASPAVRDGAAKMMRRRDIREVVEMIHDAGIHIIANYIFGLPDDTMQTMQQTLDMAMELNCEFANFYCAMAYPGSQLYTHAVEQGWQLPGSWQAFSQHAYEMVPLPTQQVSARDVLAFRDAAFDRYFKNPAYLAMIEQRFGKETRAHVEQMTTIRLKRKLLDG